MRDVQCIAGSCCLLPCFPNRCGGSTRHKCSLTRFQGCIRCVHNSVLELFSTLQDGERGANELDERLIFSILHHLKGGDLSAGLFRRKLGKSEDEPLTSEDIKGMTRAWLEAILDALYAIGWHDTQAFKDLMVK